LPLALPLTLCREQPIEAILDQHGAVFANAAEEQVSRHVVLSGTEHVAFFEVVPKETPLTQSFSRMLWTNFLGQI
jgi:hypothetical protein